MHYKNGREAKNGDKVILLDGYGNHQIGILYDAVAGNDYCNGRLAPISQNNPMPNLKDCLHIEDSGLHEKKTDPVFSPKREDDVSTFPGA